MQSRYSAYAGRGKLALKVGYPAFKVTAKIISDHTGDKNKGKVLGKVVDAFGNVLVTDHVIAFGSKKLNGMRNGDTVTFWATAYRYAGKKIGLEVVRFDDQQA